MPLLSIARNFAGDPADTVDTRSEKVAIFLVSTACCAAGCVWSAMYWAAFGFGTTAVLPLVFVLVVGAALVVAHRGGNHRIAVHAQIVCIVYVTTAIQWSIGDVVDSGFVMAWAFMGPLIALMFFSVRHALAWQGLFVINIVLTVAFDDVFSRYGEGVDETWRNFFFAMNLGVASSVVFAFAAYFVRAALGEKEKADRLLRNILPEKVARTLKDRDGVIAEEFGSVSVLFADIVDYTAYANRKSAAEVVSKLDGIFDRFDRLADRHGLEKIKTIGDAYMVVGGLPVPRSDHCRASAAMALDMLEAIATVERDDGVPFALRIGLHAGPVVAGVIGRRKFAYDLWGDTVNVASRLEATGKPGEIRVSDAVHRLLEGEFTFEPLGRVAMKGVGDVEVWNLTGRVPERKRGVSTELEKADGSRSG